MRICPKTHAWRPPSPVDQHEEEEEEEKKKFTCLEKRPSNHSLVCYPFPSLETFFVSTWRHRLGLDPRNPPPAPPLGFLLPTGNKILNSRHSLLPLRTTLGVRFVDSVDGINHWTFFAGDTPRCCFFFGKKGRNHRLRHRRLREKKKQWKFFWKLPPPLVAFMTIL